jgi:hypothetical protein
MAQGSLLPTSPARRRAKVAGVTGLEPAASGVTGRRSNQLSYTPYRAVTTAGGELQHVRPWILGVKAARVKRIG